MTQFPCRLRQTSGLRSGVVWALIFLVMVCGCDSSDPEPPRPVPEAVDNSFAEEQAARQRAREEKRQQEELAKEWLRHFVAVSSRHQTGTTELRNAVIDTLRQTESQAKAAGDRDLARRMSNDILTMRRGEFHYPTSPEGHQVAVDYIAQRLRMERELVGQLKEIKQAMPALADHSDQVRLQQMQQEADESIRQLETAQAALAGGPQVASTDAPRPQPQPRPQAPASSPSDAPAASRPAASASGATQSAPAANPAWPVQVDPPPQPVEFPEDLSYAINVPGQRFVGAKVLIAAGPTAFAAVAVEDPPAWRYVLYDLRDGKPAGLAGGVGEDPKVNSLTGPALSPDGTYLAVTQSDSKSILVGDLKEKKAVATIATDTGSKGLLFPSADRLLVIYGETKRPSEVYRLPGGELERSISFDDRPELSAGKFACSPGGRYLARVGNNDPEKILFYDLQTGEKVASLTAPGATAQSQPKVDYIAFSPDGEELAATGLGQAPGGGRRPENIVCWSMENGQVVYHRALDTGNRGGYLVTVSREPLQWFPDRQAWLLGQRWVVDRDRAAIVEELPLAGDPMVKHASKVLTNRSVLIQADRNGLRPVPVRQPTGATARP